MATIYIEKIKIKGEVVKRLACQMNRGITLYAQYLPIYKDIIAMLDKVNNEISLKV